MSSDALPSPHNQLQPEHNLVPSARNKRLRTNEENHEASKAKIRKREPQPPSNPPELTSPLLPTTEGSSTTGPSTGFFEVYPVRPVLPRTAKPHVDRRDKSAASDMQIIDSSSKILMPHTDSDSAASNKPIRNEAFKPTSMDKVPGEPLHSLVGLQNSRASMNLAPALSTYSPPSGHLFPWYIAPFTLVSVEGNKLCPRLNVLPAHGLCPILGVGQHPLGTAIAKIQQYRCENSLPCEAVSVLRTFHDIIDNGYRGDQFITFLDPLLYKSGTHSQARLEEFRMKEWGWLVCAGSPITFKDIMCGSWDLITVNANYARLEVALVLSHGGDRNVYIPAPDRAPPARELEVKQLYQEPSHNSLKPIPYLAREVLEDIIFCQRWIPTLNSEDLCAVINYQDPQIALAPYHMDDIACTKFHERHLRELGYWVENLTDLEKATRKARIMEVKSQVSKSWSIQSILSVVGW